jgi:hypothetical protein
MFPKRIIRFSPITDGLDSAYGITSSPRSAISSTNGIAATSVKKIRAVFKAKGRRVRFVHPSALRIPKTQGGGWAWIPSIGSWTGKLQNVTVVQWILTYRRGVRPTQNCTSSDKGRYPYHLQPPIFGGRPRRQPRSPRSLSMETETFKRFGSDGYLGHTYEIQTFRSLQAPNAGILWMTPWNTHPASV